MTHLSASRRLAPMLFLVLALFNIPAFAQQQCQGLIVQIPANANADNVARDAQGVIRGAIYDPVEGVKQLLLCVPSIPNAWANNDVRWVEVLRKTTLNSNPRSAKYLYGGLGASADWYKTQPPFGLIHLNNALTYATGRTIVIADINSRVDYSHPALLGHLTSGNDFVANKPEGVSTLNDESSASYLDDESSASYLDQATVSYLNESSASYLDDESSASYLDSLNPAFSHGTLVAGILAAVAPDAMIMPLTTFDANGASDLFMIAKATRWAVDNGAHVINMSFSAPCDSSVLRSAIAYAQSRGAIVTTSAGNNNTSVSQCPAAYPGVITTAATTLADLKAPFSNYGASVFIDAPGVNIISAFPGNLYAIVSGTSFSAPIAAGAAALVRSLGADAASRLAGAGIDIDALNPTYSGQLGHGRIDILRSVQP